MVGGGNQALPEKVRLDLELLEKRRFGNGMVHLRYRTAGLEEDEALRLAVEAQHESRRA